MSLTSVWLQTQADGLVRADQIVGIEAHQTPELSGKAAHWLLDVVLPGEVGSGRREGWRINVLHRTVIQTGSDPRDAPTRLASLLAQLDRAGAAGVVTADRRPDGQVRFRFVPFAEPEQG